MREGGREKKLSAVSGKGAREKRKAFVLHAWFGSVHAQEYLRGSSNNPI